MIRLLRSLFATAFVAVLSFVAPEAASAAQTQSALVFPINTSTAQGAFTGELRITSFGVQNNQLVASGIVTGSVTGAGGAVQAVAKSVTIPVATSSTGKAVAAASSTCDILHLELGPVDLNLLGLMLHLDRVVLDLSAAPGAGNLLGNLLCSVTNALNGGQLAQIANLLNQILGLLG